MVKKNIFFGTLCFLLQNVYVCEVFSFDDKKSEINQSRQIISFINSDETKFEKDKIICLGNVSAVYCGNVISTDKLIYYKDAKALM